MAVAIALYNKVTKKSQISLNLNVYSFAYYLLDQSIRHVPRKVSVCQERWFYITSSQIWIELKKNQNRISLIKEKN